MEYAEDYEEIWKFDNKNNNNYYETCILYTLYNIILLAKKGYTHGDFHHSNVMINTNIDYFFEKSGRAIFIDFGLARKLEEDEQKKINGLFKDKKYLEIIKYICTIPSGGRIMNDSYIYKYICGIIPNVNYNDKIDNLIIERKKYQESIEQTKGLPLENNDFKKALFGYMLPEELDQYTLPQDSRKMKQLSNKTKTRKISLSKMMTRSFFTRRST